MNNESLKGVTGTNVLGLNALLSPKKNIQKFLVSKTAFRQSGFSPDVTLIVDSVESERQISLPFSLIEDLGDRGKSFNFIAEQRFPWDNPFTGSTTFEIEVFHRVSPGNTSGQIVNDYSYSVNLDDTGNCKLYGENKSVTLPFKIDGKYLDRIDLIASGGSQPCGTSYSKLIFKFIDN